MPSSISKASYELFHGFCFSPHHPALWPTDLPTCHVSVWEILENIFDDCD